MGPEVRDVRDESDTLSLDEKSSMEEKEHSVNGYIIAYVLWIV